MEKQISDKVVSESKYSRKQHKDFYLFHMFHRGSSVGLILFIMLATLVLAIVNTVGALGEEQIDTSTIIFSWLMFGISFSFIPIMIISRINGIIKQETPERLNSTDKIEATKFKITRSTDITTGKSVIGWNNISLICETDKYFYIYLSEQNGIFIVKEDIKEGSVESFRRMAMANLIKDKKGRVPYKRYQTVKKEYNAMKRIEKKAKKGK